MGLGDADAEAAIERLCRTTSARDLGPVIVSDRVLGELGRVVLSDLEVHHRAQPLSQGLPREELRSRRFARAHDAVFATVLEWLAHDGRITGRERLALTSHRVELSAEEASARDAVERAFRRAHLKPLAPAELPAALGLDRSVVDRVVTLLQRQRVLIKVDELWFHADALAQLKRDVAALSAPGKPGRVDVASFKETYGLSRKFAIPLLEYLDRERVTRRVGDARVVL
jgi:selenocysteine-specific elongation factor